jgi:NAD+-dependent protein deacetylase sirtuin 4
LILNIGPSRADGHPGIEKIEIASGLIMRDVVKAVAMPWFAFNFHDK